MGKGRSIESLANPTMLKWARESIGMDVEQAARKIGTTPEKLRSWEEGGERPTMSKLREAGRVYQRPIAIFYLDVPPKDFQPMRYFRRLPSAHAAASAALNLEVRRALGRREITLDLLSLLGESPPQISLKGTLNEDPAALARRARRDLVKIPIATQLSWKAEDVAMRAWRTALEAAGVLVFQCPLPLDEMRAASMHEGTYPIILLNSKDLFVTARIFSLMHELAHLLVRQGAVCDLDPADTDRLEVFCNAFAGAFLVPAEGLDAKLGPATQRAWQHEDVRELARQFSVSIECMYRRLVDTGRASASSYRGWRQRMEERGPPTPPKKGGGNFFNNVISRAGTPYVRLVLEAFHAERITASEVAEYLGAKVDHVPRFDAIVFGPGRGGVGT